MNALEEIQRLRAAEAQTAMPLSTVRHVHLSARPMVVSAYHLSGDLGAALGFLVGTDRRRPALISVPEPRNRDLRFAAFVELADVLLPYWDSFGDLKYVTRHGRRGQIEQPIADDAPQLIFPNSPTANWVCGLLGLALRYLRTAGDQAIDPAIPALGRDLSFFNDRRSIVGQSVAIAATEFASVHWATGQMPIEDQNVHSLTAWIAPDSARARHGTNVDLRELLHVVEDWPAAGPVPDPTWDADTLAPLIDEFNRARRAGISMSAVRAEIDASVRGALMPGWEATWDLLGELSQLPPAAHVLSRWTSDRRVWGYHLHRTREDRAWFRRVPTPIQAARLLGDSEDSAGRVAIEMALDDPLVAAAQVVSGDAIEGTILDVDPSNRELGPSGRLVRRPLFRLQTVDPCALPPGTELNWRDRPALTVRIESVSPDRDLITLVATAGHGGPTLPGQFPAVGSIAAFGPWPEGEYYPPTLPREVPWTHRAAGQAVGS
jgi:hypothetical protein